MIAARLSTFPATIDDESFLYLVYKSTRNEEMVEWGWDSVQAEAFLQMQYLLKQRSYASQYPLAHPQVIVYTGQPAGYMLIAELMNELKLVDLALLPAYRNLGIGSCVLEELKQQAAVLNKSVLLQVLTTNPARFLYERHGFVVTGDDGMYYRMQFSPKGGDVAHS